MAKCERVKVRALWWWTSRKKKIQLYTCCTDLWRDVLIVGRSTFTCVDDSDELPTSWSICQVLIKFTNCWPREGEDRLTWSDDHSLSFYFLYRNLNVDRSWFGAKKKVQILWSPFWHHLARTNLRDEFHRRPRRGGSPKEAIVPSRIVEPSLSGDNPLGPQKFGRVAVVVELFYRYANCTAEQPPTKPNEFKIHETAFKCAMWFKNPFKQTVFVLFFRAKMCVNRIKCVRTSKTLSASLLNRWTTEQKQLLNWM